MAKCKKSKASDGQCEHAKEINSNGGWKFIGCTKAPHKGKWIAEIEKCPLVDSEV